MGEAEGCGIVGVLSFHSLEVGPTAVHMRRRAVDRTKRRQKVSCWGSVFVHYTHTHTHTNPLLSSSGAILYQSKQMTRCLPPAVSFHYPVFTKMTLHISTDWHYQSAVCPNLPAKLAVPRGNPAVLCLRRDPTGISTDFSLREESCHAGGLARRMLLGTVSPLRLAPLSGAVRRRRPWHFHSQCWICFQYKIHQSSVSLRRCQRDIWIWFVGPQGEHLLLACTYR